MSEYFILPYDALFEILLNSERDACDRFCSIPAFEALCKDELLWSRKMEKDFPEEIMYKPDYITYKQQWRDLSLLDEIKKGSIVESGRVDIALVQDEGNLDKYIAHTTPEFIEKLITSNKVTTPDALLIILDKLDEGIDVENNKLRLQVFSKYNIVPPDEVFFKGLVADRDMLTRFFREGKSLPRSAAFIVFGKMLYREEIDNVLWLLEALPDDQLEFILRNQIPLDNLEILDYFHERGITLEPEEIVISLEEGVDLLDWALSKGYRPSQDWLEAVVREGTEDNFETLIDLGFIPQSNDFTTAVSKGDLVLSDRILELNPEIDFTELINQENVDRALLDYLEPSPFDNHLYKVTEELRLLDFLRAAIYYDVTVSPHVVEIVLQSTEPTDWFRDVIRDLYN